MRNTTKYGITIPSSGDDPDDVPTHLGDAIDAIDGLLGIPGGTYATRPVSSAGTAGIVGRLYYVTSGTNAGALYRDNGAGWDLLNGSYGMGVTGDVKTLGWGDTPNIGTSTKGWAAADHDHGTPANPVVAHVAASNPHPQYELAADLVIQISRYCRQFLLGGM